MNYVYNKSGFDLSVFVNHAYKAVEGRIETPVFEAPSHVPRPTEIRFTFTNELLERILARPHHYKKDFQAAFLGYVGGCRGGRNGIVRVRSSDTRLNDRLSSYAATHPEALNNLKNPVSVKIVCHKKNGERIIGFLDQSAGKAVFVDQVAYKR